MNEPEEIHRPFSAVQHRPFPASPEAEFGILNAITVAPKEAFPKIRSAGIMPEFFHIPSHKLIFEVMLEMEAGGKSGNMSVGIGGIVTCGDFIILTEELRGR